MSLTACYRLLIAALVLCCALAAMPASARQNAIDADLIAAGPVSPGGTVTLAIRMRPDPGWHGYWLNPGDAGLGMQLDWQLPDGIRAGQPRYPVPQTLLISGLMNHVYLGEYAVLVPISVGRDVTPGTIVPIAVEAQWLACTDEICVPEQGRMEARLNVSQAGLDTEPDRRFDAWRARLPAPLNASASFAISGDSIRLALPLPRTAALDDPHVFVAPDRIADYAAEQRFSRNGDTVVIELDRARFSPVDPQRFSGVLRLNERGDGLSFEAVRGTVPPAGKAVGDGPATGLPLLLLAALAGGLLLNIMPCVFPILSLKALSLARAGESERQARAEGLAYTGGVVVACLGLGGLLLGLRAAGEQVGWAFQLQEPLVVATLLPLAAAITANFLGLFEARIPGFASAGSPQGAFATGLLAAFVATPCTGPFMAAAMGAALLLPVPYALALFAVLGLGIALPFLAVAFIPALRRRLPRPGPWMNRFRRWMALPMGLTALALLWLAGRVGGDDFALVAGLLTGALIVLLWLIGRRQGAAKPVSLLASGGVLVLIVTGAIALPPLASGPVAAASAGTLPAQPFSAAALAEARRAGKPVFAWFTADWCLTCKVNERVAIEREETRAAFEAAGVVVLRGDWTRRDPAITRFLTEHDAAGVPLYVWYPPDAGAPRILPQVLTPSMLTELARSRN